MLRSGLLTSLSKLMQAENCVQFCLKPFCHEVNEGHLGK